MQKVILPLFIMLPRKTKADKRISLNLNVYRNLNYIVNNMTKQKFKEVVSPLIAGKRFETPIQITYTLYPKTKRSLDIANVLCVVDKFFCDTLVENGCIEDDNFHFLPKVIYQFGKIDKCHSRVEAVIETMIDNLEQDKILNKQHARIMELHQEIIKRDKIIESMQ